jgi:hypothetical protein
MTVFSLSFSCTYPFIAKIILYKKTKLSKPACDEMYIYIVECTLCEHPDDEYFSSFNTQH